MPDDDFPCCSNGEHDTDEYTVTDVNGNPFTPGRVKYPDRQADLFGIPIGTRVGKHCSDRTVAVTATSSAVAVSPSSTGAELAYTGPSPLMLPLAGFGFAALVGGVAVTVVTARRKKEQR